MPGDQRPASAEAVAGKRVGIGEYGRRKCRWYGDWYDQHPLPPVFRNYILDKPTAFLDNLLVWRTP